MRIPCRDRLSHFKSAPSANLQPININPPDPGLRHTRRQPPLRILVVKRPGRDNREERNQRAREPNVQRERDVLRHEADEESDDLTHFA